MTGNPLALASPEETARRKEKRVHRYGRGEKIICVTDDLGKPKHEWRSDANVVEAIRNVSDNMLTEIVVGTGDGTIPLWAEHSTLRWRFNDVSMQAFSDPEAAKAAIEALFDEAVGRWSDACPVKFVQDESRFDFEIVMRSQKRCSMNGCVLASAFFPDGGQHELVLYPSMFEQDSEEQIETLVHEIGHIFGLRHFFALISETAWPAEVYGQHSRFSIMNYGDDSKLMDSDKEDLKSLYAKVWDGSIAGINGTPVRLMRPFTAQTL